MKAPKMKTAWISYLPEAGSRMREFQEDEARILEEIAAHESAIKQLRAARDWVQRDALKFARGHWTSEEIGRAQNDAAGVTP